jgi:hypothetical protein
MKIDPSLQKLAVAADHLDQQFDETFPLVLVSRTLALETRMGLPWKYYKARTEVCETQSVV